MTSLAARRVLERTTGQIVISLYLDLDPDRFATPPARASQIRSLLDDARRRARELTIDHDAARVLEQDLARLEDDLVPDDLPATARGLAVFCSGGDDLYLTIPLASHVEPEVHVQPAAQVEPLVTDPGAARWCAVLVSLDDAHILEGDGGQVRSRTRAADYVRGIDHAGGASTHTREQDIRGHLKQVASELRRRFQAGEFEVLAIGGPVDPLTGLEADLPDELSAALIGRLSIDPSASSDTDVAAAVERLVDERRAHEDEQALAELRDRMGGGGRVAVGISEVQEALIQRSVSTLMLSRDYDDPENRREALVQTAVLQDADVRVYDQAPELPAPRPVAALLRY
jgi:peptide chain release factor subunit 1